MTSRRQSSLSGIGWSSPGAGTAKTMKVAPLSRHASALIDGARRAGAQNDEVGERRRRWPRAAGPAACRRPQPRPTPQSRRSVIAQSSRYSRDVGREDAARAQRERETDVQQPADPAADHQHRRARVARPRASARAPRTRAARRSCLPRSSSSRACAGCRGRSAAQARARTARIRPDRSSWCAACGTRCDCPRGSIGRCCPGTWWETTTRSPTRRSSTPSPTATTSPATSWPSTIGALGTRYHSSTSEPQMPLALDAHERLAGADLGDRPLLDADVGVVVVDRDRALVSGSVSAGLA